MEGVGTASVDLDEGQEQADVDNGGGGSGPRPSLDDILFPTKNPATKQSADGETLGDQDGANEGDQDDQPKRKKDKSGDKITLTIRGKKVSFDKNDPNAADYQAMADDYAEAQKKITALGQGKTQTGEEENDEQAEQQSKVDTERRQKILRKLDGELGGIFKGLIQAFNDADDPAKMESVAEGLTMKLLEIIDSRTSGFTQRIEEAIEKRIGPLEENFNTVNGDQVSERRISTFAESELPVLGYKADALKGKEKEVLAEARAIVREFPDRLVNGSIPPAVLAAAITRVAVRAGKPGPKPKVESGNEQVGDTRPPAPHSAGPSSSSASAGSRPVVPRTPSLSNVLGI